MLWGPRIRAVRAVAEIIEGWGSPGFPDCRPRGAALRVLLKAWWLRSRQEGKSGARGRLLAGKGRCLGLGAPKVGKQVEEVEGWGH